MPEQTPNGGNTSILPGSEQAIGRYYRVSTYTDGSFELTDTLRNVTIHFTAKETCLLWDYLLHHIGFIEAQENKGQ